MTSKKRVKRPATKFKVPDSHSACNDAIFELGKLQRKREAIITDTKNQIEAMKEAMKALKNKVKDEIKPLDKQIKETSDGIHMFCEANRAKLTKNETIKYHQFDAGEVNWRYTPPAVTFKGTLAELLAEIQKMQLREFIRIKEEADRDAMLRNPELARTVEGVEITQREEFVITPNDTNIEEAA